MVPSRPDDSLSLEQFRAAAAAMGSALATTALPERARQTLGMLLYEVFMGSEDIMQADEAGHDRTLSLLGNLPVPTGKKDLLDRLAEFRAELPRVLHELREGEPKPGADSPFVAYEKRSVIAVDAAIKAARVALGVRQGPELG